MPLGHISFGPRDSFARSLLRVFSLADQLIGVLFLVLRSIDRFVSTSSGMRRAASWGGNATVRVGLRHVVRFFLAYFKHHLRASDLAAAASSSRRRCSSSRSTVPSSTPATRLDTNHDVLRTATSTTATPPTLLATSTNGTKGYRHA